LAAYDEALAAGVPLTVLHQAGMPSHMQPQLQDGLDCMQLLRKALPRQDQDSAVSAGQDSAAEVTATPSLPCTSLGRFKLRRELGRGGFGVVFLAYDPQLGRDVALKVPRPDAIASPQMLDRFHQEGRAAAGLDHPHIVPVYEAGALGPICYIASAYCPGITLAAWLKQYTQPVPIRLAAALTATLAEAVQHAHSRGVLHRDLKPSNVLLSPLGMSGDGSGAALSSSSSSADALTFIPKITDFGLAKLLPSLTATAPEGQDAVKPTRSGAILGTPSYMAPEQAQGKSSQTGPAADVYGMGAILYELLTKRPPFVGESDLDILQQVQEEEPVSPVRLRPKTPRDLETICLKCLRKEPHRRYATSLALGEDLRRFLAGEPIRARPTPSWERLLKWGRRRPAQAIAAALGAVLMAGLVLSTVLIRHQRDEIETSRLQVQKNYEIAEEQRNRAENNLQKARMAVDKMLTSVGEQGLRNVPQMERLRQQLLQDALELNQEFLQDNSADPAVRREISLAHARVARIDSLLGKSAAAEEAYRRAIALSSKLASEFPAAPQYREDLASAMDELGLLLRNLGRLKESEEAYRSAVAQAEQLVAQVPDAPLYQQTLGTAQLNFAQLLANTGQLADAEEGYQRALGIWSKLAREFPNVPRHRQVLAAVYNNLGLFFATTDRPEESEQTYHKALDLRQQLAAEFPQDLEYQEHLAHVCDNLGGFLQAQERLEESEQFLGRALAIRERLMAAFPYTPEYQQALARLLHNLALVQDSRGRPADAEKSNRRALALQDKLAAEFPDVPAYRQELALSRGHLGALLQKAGRLEGAEIEYRQSLTALGKLVAASPQVSDYHSQYGDSFHNLAVLMEARGDVTQVRELAEQAANQQRSAVQLNPKNLFYRRHLEAHVILLTNAFLRLGLHAEAAAAAAELVKDFPEIPDRALDAAALWARCASAAERDERLVAAKRHEAARAYADRAMTLLQGIVSLGFHDAKLLHENKDYDALRPRTDFQKLLREVEQNTLKQAN
jgi:serine/threonine protein kinase